MKYYWVEENKTCNEISQEIGTPIKSITRGDIIIGYVDTIDVDGKSIKLPITRSGVELELDDNIDIAKLEKLDRKFVGLKREGGKDLAQEVEELKSRMENLEVEHAKL